MRQLFAIGQTVSIAGDSLTGPATTGLFRVVRRYRLARKPPMYHVRSLDHGGQRMVPEDELATSMPCIFGLDGVPSKVVHLFPNIVQLHAGCSA